MRPFSRHFSGRRRRVTLALFGLPLAACEAPPDADDQEATRQRLVGNWLREYQEDGARVRRLLVLEADGRFRESTRAVDAQGQVIEHEHAGQWLFDGTNLKRRYTSMDGKRPSAPTVPFATFELRFESKYEFVGTDRVHNRVVRYQRFDGDTLS